MDIYLLSKKDIRTGEFLLEGAFKDIDSLTERIKEIDKENDLIRDYRITKDELR